MRNGIRRALFVLSLGLVALAAAEITARVDDWIRLGIPLGRTPDYDHDLKYRDWFGIRGRPNGRYRQWQLNNFGFRGPDMAALKAPGCRRVLTLGASESFGLYESENREYPAQLRDSLAGHGCYEVVNSAIVGVGIRGIIRLWENYSARFRPDVVLLYPSPSFYLAGAQTKWAPMPGKPEAEHELSPRPRLLEQLHNVWETPAFMQKRRLERWIAADTAGKPPDWFFTAPPEDRLDLFVADLDSLVKSIRARGVTPIILTHAMRISVPPRPDDQMLLLGWRRLNPRATTAALLGFETKAAQRERDYAAREHVLLVDLARVMSGRKEYFADFVHFTDEGAATVAGIVARRLVESEQTALRAPPQATPRVSARH